VLHSGSFGFPYTHLLLLLQHLAQGATDVLEPQEEVIWERDAVATAEATHATTLRAMEASALEDAVVWESTMTLVKEAED
jgi:hypothetical protein